MNGLRKLSLLAVTLLFGAFAAVAQKPNIHILATGGTIAGTGASATNTELYSRTSGYRHIAGCSARSE